MAGDEGGKKDYKEELSFYLLMTIVFYCYKSVITYKDSKNTVKIFSS